MRLSAKNLSILRDPVFDLPKQRPEGDFANFLESAYAAFFGRLSDFEDPLASLLRARLEGMRALATDLVAAWRLNARGDDAAAYRRVAGALDSMRDSLVAMSRRHSAEVLPGQSFYRLASWKGVELRKHMFHTPFEMKSKSYRFSTPDRPTLYLGNSVYLCWLECGGPAETDSYVSRFELDSSGFELLDIAGSHQLYLAPFDFPDFLDVDPRAVTNSPFATDVMSELADYLAAWPLFAAVSVQKREPPPDHPPEYVIPQMLMHWAADQEGLFGVRYFTSKNDPSSNSQDWAINFAIPTRTKKASGYCDFLRERALCTLPQNLGMVAERSLGELVTRETGDRRNAALGRNMFVWPDGSMDQYIRTPFGKMEYWLDRADLSVAPIEED